MVGGDGGEVAGGHDVDVAAAAAVATGGGAEGLVLFAVEGDAAVTAVAWGVLVGVLVECELETHLRELAGSCCPGSVSPGWCVSTSSSALA